ncbi:O-antigen ligase family protein [Winogradskyella sp. 3972H.M.0a.05]|uniref:O-antigen ligase family protein n=1 Tax=Winogradskyella sp. 3972H.M.0a.05 TaxID=2950277 RepID=UPI003394E517
MHPIYASLYLSISLVFAVHIYKLITTKLKKVVFLICVVFLAIILAILTRKGIIATSFLIFLIHFSKNQKRRNLIWFLIITFGLLIIGYNIPPIKNRFSELLEAFLNSNNSKLGSTTIRMMIYDCSLSLIGDNPLLGYGVGDTKAVLSECYFTNSNITIKEYYNSHNQFLSAWLAAGVIGVASLLGMVLYNLKLAIKSSSFVHISVIILFFVSMLTENILERQNGVLLFSFIINLFAFEAYKKTVNE